jgi:3-oxoacyl-[acyl-carrier protein] reductase
MRLTPVRLMTEHAGGPFSLSGRRAIVTGGSRGIGRAVTQLLVSAGVDVCIGYRSRHADADAVRAALGVQGARVVTYSADLADPGEVDGLFRYASETMGGVDIVVHSAGVWPVEDVPVHDMSAERWHHTMRQNLDAMFFVSRAAARALSSGGRIVHVASTAGQRGEANHADYAASKGAMIAFVKSQAVELASRGIAVNCVAPGWVDTEMCAVPFADGGAARIGATIPVGRVASAEDIAWAVVTLCMPGARHVIGEIVNVNGGSVLCG